MPSSVVARVAGESLTLFPQRAVFWDRARTLIIADPHFGKAASFRAAGIPVPQGTTSTDLARLDHLLGATRAVRLLVLGDFFHARTSRAPATLAALSVWRERRRDVHVVLVRGNHDVRAGDPPLDWHFEIVPHALVEHPFRFIHDPADEIVVQQQGASPDDQQAHNGSTATRELYTLAGHVHPAVRLRDVAGTVTAACFHFGASTGLLPAFGSFTGKAVVRPKRGDQVFVLGPADEIVEIPTRAA